MKVRFEVGTNIAGSEVSDVIEVEDDMTDDEIEEYFQNWIWEQLDYSWRKV